MTEPARAFRRATRASAAFALCSGIAIAATVTAPAALAAPSSVARPSVVDLGVADVLDLLESGEQTSVALVQEYLDRIAAYDDPYGDQPGLAAVILTNPEALATAAERDAERADGEIRGPLHGVPVLVKDNYATFDLPTTAGSASLHTYRTAADSTAVARLRDAGAIILAKTNMSEFAWHGRFTLSSERGRTANPYNQALSASGSSGGTGAGVAASFGPAGLGTDSCGSIIGPSAHGSLVGYRPTMGLTSVNGIVPLSARQDVSGPMTKTVTDAALLMEVLAGYDPADPLTEIAVGQNTDEYVEGLSDTALEGKRIGYFHWDFEEQPGYPGLAETTAIIDQAVLDLEAQGAEIVDVPFTREFVQTVLASGGWIDIRPSIDAFFAATEAEWPEGLAELTAPVDALTFSDVVADGKTSLTQDTVDYFLSNEDIPNTAYDAAVAAQDAGKLAIDAFFEEHDLDAMAMPTSEVPAAPDGAGTAFCDLGANTGIPTMSVPAGFTESGLPIGLELAAPRNHDAELLAMAYDYEQATLHRVAPASTPELPREVEEPPVEEPPVSEPDPGAETPVTEPDPGTTPPAPVDPGADPGAEEPDVDLAPSLPTVPAGETPVTLPTDDAAPESEKAPGALAATGAGDAVPSGLAALALMVTGAAALVSGRMRDRRRRALTSPGAEH
ncbi:amidase family protein [Planctomonas deserti]|uniref:amidase family protein n=1 Tax=Planctomonas deserti TaxID=2144185 RepID=UPI000D3B1D94|nr:amidase family protein [Planctomonas deserti]